MSTEAAQLKPFHSAAGGVGVYHQLGDCSHAKRISPWNRCDAGPAEEHVRGCIWKGVPLDPCPKCGAAWP